MFGRETERASAEQASVLQIVERRAFAGGDDREFARGECGECAHGGEGGVDGLGGVAVAREVREVDAAPA